HRVWWLAFCGEGNPAPDISPPRDFDERGDDGIAGEDAVDEDRSAASQEKETYASGGLARARDEEGSAAAAGEEVTDTVSRRVAWVRGAAMQMIMCAPTFGYYLTLGQL
ncbi:unnamed protein product, partial [Pylaiella littoralis]